MTDGLEQILTDWKHKLEVINQNLLDLQDLPVYQRLSLVKSDLTGITAERITPALGAMNDLFEYFDLLAGTVDKASKLKDQLPRFLTTVQQVNDIKQILIGPSIQLPTVQTPLAQRGLLSSKTDNNTIEPIQLLALMTSAFTVARDAVLAVDAAWTKLDLTLNKAEEQATSLEKLALSSGKNYLSELTQARGVIASLRTRVEQDPLGVTLDIEQQIQPILTQVKTTLEQGIKQQVEVREKLATSHKMLEQLQELHLKSLEVFAESQAKVVDHSIGQTPLNQVEIDAIGEWLNRLETKLAEGLVSPVMIGLDNWMRKARAAIVSTQQIYTSHTNLLQTRQELRGRLDALQAKALARRLIEDPTLTDLAEQAKQLLYKRPTPLNQATALVSEYEKRLNHRL